MEDDPWLNAGVGSSLNAVGEIEVDALIMDGSNLKVGAVAAVRRVKSAVRLARLVMQATPHAMLAGPGAEQLAEQYHLRVPLVELLTPYEVERWRRRRAEAEPGDSGDTVGAVALDSHGHLAAATSTGGMANKLHGRVGDSPLVGCGGYADDLCGAASATGHGESIMRVVLSKLACDLMASGHSPDDSARGAVATLAERTGGQAGIIVLNPSGVPGFAHNTLRMPVAYSAPGGAIVTASE
jgi:beta-aspartyl-peptidase (threonine type)